MTASMTDDNSTALHNGPTQANTQECPIEHASAPHTSSTPSHPQKISHRRGSSLPALRHLEKMGGDHAKGRHDSASEDDDDDDQDDCVGTPHDSSDLDDFVKGFCDSDNMLDVDSRVWVVQSRVALD